MGKSVVTHGLVKRRARVLGKIQYHEKEIRQLQEVANALAVSIKAFEPSYNLTKIKPIKLQKKRNVFFRAGHGTRVVLDILREENQSLTIPEIGLEAALLSEHKITDSNLSALHASIRTILYKLQARNIAKSFHDSDGLQRWCLN